VHSGFGVSERPLPVDRRRTEATTAAVDQPEADEHEGQQGEHDRCEIDQEGDEVQPDGPIDEDVRRVADQSGGAADIAGDDLGDQEQSRVELQILADGDRDRPP